MMKVRVGLNNQRFLSTAILRAIIAAIHAFFVCTLSASSPSAKNSTAVNEDVPSLLRVMTYNIRAADYGIKGIIDTLKQGKADIIALQEVDKLVRRTGRIDQPKKIARSLGINYVFRKHFSYQGGEFGLALLSRYKIDHVKRVPVRRSNLILLKARVHTPDRPVTVIVVHFHPSTNPLKNNAILFREAKRAKAACLREAKRAIEAVKKNNAVLFHETRCAKAACLREAKRAIEAVKKVNAVLFHEARCAKAARLREAKRAIELATSHDTPFLIMGDFNATFMSQAYSLFAEKFQDCCRIGGGLWDKTWPAKFPITRIDYIWVSRHFRVLKCRTLNSNASDHLPVIAEIQPKELR